ncbi:hypothetical protein PIB30_071444 [Stylosanthes scabra]|uniref:Uncharacterized protein n=1 Tax=Stylosanthes scabra TaxID=79078 RepID=A0ABU6VM65_9FABA|nr:hypothetical protein [Stylosanthes scabra]
MFGPELQVDGEGPKNILENLQSLCYVRPDSVLESLINNGCFPNLKTLGLVLYPEDKQGGGTEELRRLHCLSNLRYLKLWFQSHLLFCKAALSIDAMENLSNLTKITLNGLTTFTSSNMAALGRISNLQILKLKMLLVGKSTLSCGDVGSFPKLQVFLMLGLASLQSLRLEEGKMPCLQRMVIYDCSTLKEIPKRLFSKTNLRDLHGDIWKEADDDSNKTIRSDSVKESVFNKLGIVIIVCVNVIYVFVINILVENQAKWWFFLKTLSFLPNAKVKVQASELRQNRATQHQWRH